MLQVVFSRANLAKKKSKIAKTDFKCYFCLDFYFNKMKTVLKYPYCVFQWLVVLPLCALATILTAISTTFLSFCTKNPRVWAFPSRCWSRFTCAICFVRVSVEGWENIPDKNKSYIFVANHQSMFDIWLIYGWLDRPFSWIMKQELRKVPFVGKACESIGHIFVDRSSAMAAKNSIINAKKRLQNGSSVVIFPEGTRSKNGKVGVFKRGAFTLASDVHLPIVPITIVGAYDRMNRNAFFVTPGRMKMIIHPPIEASAAQNEQETRRLANMAREIIVSGLPAKYR